MRYTRNNFRIVFLCLSDETLSCLIGCFKKEEESWKAKCPFSFWINDSLSKCEIRQIHTPSCRATIWNAQGFLTALHSISVFPFWLFSIICRLVSKCLSSWQKRERSYYSPKAYCRSHPKLFASLIKQLKNRNTPLCKARWPSVLVSLEKISHKPFLRERENIFINWLISILSALFSRNCRNWLKGKKLRIQWALNSHETF